MIHKNQHFSIILLVLITFLSSCENKPSDFGKDIISPKDSVLSYTDSSTAFTVYPTIPEKVISGNVDSTFTTTYPNKLLLGHYEDNTFGRTNCRFMIEFTREQADSLLYGIDQSDIESVFIEFKIDSSFGGSDSNNITIYPINQDFSTLKYSDADPSSYYDATDIMVESNPVEYDPQSNKITVALTPDFVINYLADGQDTLCGFYAEGSTNATNEKRLVSINPYDTSGTRLLVNLTDTIKRFFVSTDDPRINLFEQDYSNATFQHSIDNPSSNQDSAFIQTMGGVETIVELDSIKNWPEEMNTIIEAKLIIPYHSSNHFAVPTQLALIAKDTAGTKTILDDDPRNSGSLEYFGGQPKDGTISFNITQYIQAIVDGEKEINRLHLLPGVYAPPDYQLLYYPAADIGRIILQTGGDNGMYLKIKYVKLD